MKSRNDIDKQYYRLSCECVKGGNILRLQRLTSVYNRYCNNITEHFYIYSGYLLTIDNIRRLSNTPVKREIYARF